MLLGGPSRARRSGEVRRRDRGRDSGLWERSANITCSSRPPFLFDVFFQSASGSAAGNT
jgi:hypothetical protein